MLVKSPPKAAALGGQAWPRSIVDVMVRIRFKCPKLLAARSSGVTYLGPCCISSKGASFDRGGVLGVSVSRSRRLRESLYGTGSFGNAVSSTGVADAKLDWTGAASVELPKRMALFRTDALPALW